MVHLEKVTKRFGKVTALHELDLRVQKGEVFGFIGPNGAGKTTAIRIVMGILKADGGRARVFGMDAWRDAVEIHRRIAYVPGDVSLWPNLTGGEVIDLFVRLRKGERRAYREDLVERFDFDPSKKCRTYSKGNRQKVALVAAFASDADLYILDEPTSGLDPLMESVFQQCVAEAAAAGKSVLLSSHILSEVERLCGKVAIIRQGTIIESGEMSSLRHLTRTNVWVKTEKPLDGFLAHPHIHDAEQVRGGLGFGVDTQMLGSVVAELSGYGIVGLECMPPTLEQLFMSHYSEGRG